MNKMKWKMKHDSIDYENDIVSKMSELHVFSFGLAHSY